jgi:hypothetical protein
MKNIYTLLIVAGLFLALSQTTVAQENHGNALNLFVKFGENSSISGNYEFQVHPDITVSPEARIWFGGKNTLAVGARGDYYFDRIFNLSEPWDIWGGVDAGFVLAGDDDKDGFGINIHAGGEYKFNDMWGLILELGGGTTASGGIGVGIHF